MTGERLGAINGMAVTVDIEWARVAAVIAEFVLLGFSMFADRGPTGTRHRVVNNYPAGTTAGRGGQALPCKICRPVYSCAVASKGDLTKARLAESMLALIQTSGYSGTGLNAVIEHAAAPKGSIYFHFPDGKEGLGVAAVELAAQQFETLIAEAAGAAGGPAEAARAAIEALTTIVSESNFRLGCPVSVVTLEMSADSERLRQACATAFDSWITPTATFLEASGIAADEARPLATVVVSTIEGAIIVSRAMQSTQPLTAAGDVVAELINQRCQALGGTR